MGIDLATWRARIGLNYYHMCRPLQTRWRSSGRLFQPGVANWGVGEIMNDTPLVLKDCVMVVALSLMLQYVHFTSRQNGRGGGGKVHCHWRGTTSEMRDAVDGGVMLLLRATVVVIPLLLVIAGDVETNPGPPKREGVTLKAAINELHSVCPKWYIIGIQLDIPTSQLKIFDQKTSNPMDQLCDTLDYWMNHYRSPSWKILVDALKAPSVGEERLAEEIEEKYCDPEEQSSCKEPEISAQVAKSPQEVLCQYRYATTLEQSTFSTAPAGETTSSTTIAAEYSSSTSPPPNEGTKKPPFECGCAVKCTLSSFIERGCPKPISSASFFPYLDFTGLTDKQKGDLRERLQFESQEIMMQFQKLVSATIESLFRQNVSPQRLVSHIMTLVTFDPVFHKPQVPILQECLEELEGADTIFKVFLILKNYFSFFNYDIIEHIIEVLGTEEDKTKLQKYEEKFDQYARRRIYECGPQFGPENETDHPNIVIKLDSRYDNYTVAEIKSFCHKLSETLHLSSKGVLFLVRVDKGCIQLTLQIPLFVQKEVFPLSREQERTLEAEGVIKLSCGEYHVQFPDDKDSAEKLHHDIGASAQGPTAVLRRQGQSGHYRGQLNIMYQNKVITKPEIEELEHRNESGGVTGYTGIVRFEVVATGEKKAFSGSGPSKSAANEDAAQTAVNEIDPSPVAEAIKTNPSASGLAVIISNAYGTTPGLQVLNGTTEDGKMMTSAFTFLKFATLWRRNTTGHELMQLLSEVSCYRNYPKSFKCIAFVFSGHGLDANHLYMQDGSLITINNVVEALLPKQAPQIGSIPKLFFIDACRGKRVLSNEAVVVPQHGGTTEKVQETPRQGASDEIIHVPPKGNFLVAYSTMPDYQSYEVKGKGGVWMTSLAERLRTSSHSVQDILSEVNNDLMQKFQEAETRPFMIQPEYISRLHGKLCLWPGGYAVPAVRVQGPIAVLSRQGQSGRYRGELNVMYQDKVITKPEIEEIEHHSESGGVTGYTGVVRFQIVATGEKKTFSGSGPSKSAAHEDAAQTAVNEIQHLTVARSDAPVVPPKQASISSTIKHSSISPKVMPAALSMSPSKTAVTTLKEYCEKKGLPKPQYSEIPLHKEQQFQFKVSLKSVEVTGKVCGSKQQAKQSAAQLVIQKLGL